MYTTQLYTTQATILVDGSHAGKTVYSNFLITGNSTVLCITSRNVHNWQKNIVASYDPTQYS